MLVNCEAVLFADGVQVFNALAVLGSVGGVNAYNGMDGFAAAVHERCDGQLKLAYKGILC